MKNSKTKEAVPPSKQKLLNALNRMDEFASEATRDNDNGEAQRLEKDYNLLFNFISNLKNPHEKK